MWFLEQCSTLSALKSSNKIPYEIFIYSWHRSWAFHIERDWQSSPEQRGREKTHWSVGLESQEKLHVGILWDALRRLFIREPFGYWLTMKAPIYGRGLSGQLPYWSKSALSKHGLSGSAAAGILTGSSGFPCLNRVCKEWKNPQIESDT